MYVLLFTGKLSTTHNSIIQCMFYQSQYREVVRGEISMEIFEIWTDFGPVGNTEKNWADYEQLLRAVFVGCKNIIN